MAVRLTDLGKVDEDDCCYTAEGKVEPRVGGREGLWALAQKHCGSQADNGVGRT